jgi:WhiB family redox-sensing transcriptional regulator
MTVHRRHRNIHSRMGGDPWSLFDLLGAEPWMRSGVCREVDPELWFPTQGSDGTARLAKQICHTCPVVAECLDYAMRRGERDGIWGATSERDRRKLRRQAALTDGWLEESA